MKNFDCNFRVLKHRKYIINNFEAMTKTIEL